MPAPTASQLQPIIDGLLQQEGLRGEDAPALAKALATTLELSLAQMAVRTLVAPGIPCTPAATAGPGRLL